MNRQVLKIFGWVAVVLLVLGVGAALGGGIVYATTRADREGPVLVVPEELDPEPGIVVASVVPDGPAAEAGVVRGDILLEVGGEAVDNVAELALVLREHEVGDEVALRVLHGGDERTLTATLGDRDGKSYLGLVPCAPMPDSDLKRFGVRVVAPGAMIVDVEPESPADQAGLEAGDVIFAVDGQEIDPENTLADVIAEYEPGNEVTLEVRRPGEDEELREVTVELGEHPEKDGVAYLGVRYRPSFPIHISEAGPVPFEWHYEWQPGWRLDQLPHRRFFQGELPPIPLEGEVMQGAIVRRVEEDSPADAAGLRQGDVITAIEGDPVEGPQDVLEAIAEHAPGDQVTLTVHQRGEEEEREVEVTLAEHPDEEDKAYLGVVIGGFVHVRRFQSEHGDQDYELELDLDFDWEAPLDELPFDFDAIPKHFEFDDMPEHFEFHLPAGPLGIDEANCCEGGV